MCLCCKKGWWSYLRIIVAKCVPQEGVTILEALFEVYKSPNCVKIVTSSVHGAEGASNKIILLAFLLFLLFPSLQALKSVQKKIKRWHTITKAHYFLEVLPFLRFDMISSMVYSTWSMGDTLECHLLYKPYPHRLIVFYPHLFFFRRVNNISTFLHYMVLI